MFKPIEQAKAEVLKSAWVCRHYAQYAQHYLQDEVIILNDTSKGIIKYEPVGVILSIMPWNFPFWQVFRLTAAAIMAGNVVLLKHAPNVPLCAAAIANIFLKVGFPPNIYTDFRIDIPEVEAVIAAKEVRLITLTGSEKAGRSVAALAGKYLKKCILELGGSDAFIVLPDADIRLAAQNAVRSRFANSGQTCLAAKRWLLHRDIQTEFLAHATDFLEQETITHLARPDLADNFNRQLQDTLSKGGKIIHKGNQKTTDGISPLLIDHISPESAFYQEEIFGAAAAIFPFETIDEAIQLANDTNYGLGAAIWSADTALAEHIANQLEVGFVAINKQVSSDPRLPFGGTKNSGYGRELGKQGIQDLCNIKTILY